LQRRCYCRPLLLLLLLLLLVLVLVPVRSWLVLQVQLTGVLQDLLLHACWALVLPAWLLLLLVPGVMSCVVRRCSCRALMGLPSVTRPYTCPWCCTISSSEARAPAPTTSTSTTPASSVAAARPARAIS
jgi:hypothetical protein